MYMCMYMHMYMHMHMHMNMQMHMRMHMSVCVRSSHVALNVIAPDALLVGLPCTRLRTRRKKRLNRESLTRRPNAFLHRKAAMLQFEPRHATLDD